MSRFIPTRKDCPKSHIGIRETEKEKETKINKKTKNHNTQNQKLFSDPFTVGFPSLD